MLTRGPEVRGTRLSLMCLLIIINMLFVTFVPMVVARAPDGPDVPGAISSRQGPAPDTAPDLTVTNITLSNQDPVDGVLISVFATIENTGQETAEDFVIAIYSAGQQISSVHVTALGPGNSTTASAEVRVHAGFLEVRVVADLDDQVYEVSEANNFMVHTTRIGSSDLYFSDLSFFPANYTDGDTVLVTATLVNGGADTTNPFTCLLMVDDGVIRSKTFHGLGSGDSLILSGEWTASSGSHEILAKADTGANVGETNESNNMVLRPLGTSYPDLTIERVGTQPSLDNVTDGDTIVIETTVRNMGADTHSTFNVRFMVDGIELASSSINGLGTNGSRDMSFQWLAQGGRHEIRVDVDGGGGTGQVLESNEGNNYRLIDADLPLTDLWIKDLVLDPFFPVDGSTMTIRAEVRNDGPGGTHRPFYVQFLSNGDVLGQASVKGLEANSTTYANMTFTAVAGRSEIGVELDGARLIPEVDESNNAAFTTLTVPFPDLTIMNLTTTTGLKDGDTGTIRTTVLNLGPGNTTSSFYVDFIMDGEVISRVPVTGIPVGIPVTVSTPFIARGGSSQVSVRADGDQVIKEADETNNALITYVDIGMPDIRIEDLAWAPASPSVGEVVTLTAVLANDGMPTSREVYLEFIMDGTIIASTAIPGPSFIGSVNVNALWKFLGNEDRLEVRADSVMEIPEADETNNNMTRTFPNGSLVPAPPGPDLVIKDVSWLPLDPSDGEEVSFVVSIKNDGAMPDPGPDGSGALHPSVTIFVDNEKVATTDLRLLSTEAMAVLPWVASVGHHDIRAIIDRGGTELETNETNNALAVNMTVGGPDLSLSDLEFVTGTPDDGNTVVMFVQVDNSGNRTLRGFSLHYYVDGIHIGKEDVEGVLLNRSTTITHNWKATPGDHTVTVMADLYGALKELDETNNHITGNISVKRSNLRIISMVAASEVEDGSQSLVTVRVRNDGQGGTVRSFMVSYYLDGEEQGNHIIHGLPSGNEVVVSRSISPGPGKHHIRVVVDTAGAVAETDEGDNVVSRPGLNVSSSDLGVREIRLLSQDDMSTVVFADIENTGNTTTRSFSVAFYSDGEIISSTKFDGLPSGHTSTVTTPWSHGFGSHRLRVVVDPWSSIAETDETDNEGQLVTPFLPYPDLYIDEVDIMGPMVAGGEIALVAKVRNLGGDTRTPFSVQFHIDGELLGETSVGGLPANGYAFVSFRTYGVVGQHHLRADVDPGDRVAEVDEMNNAQSTTYTINAPDLRVTQIEVYVHPDGVAIFAKVRNDGAHLLSPVVISFYGDGDLVAEAYLRGLPALTSTQVMEIIPTDTEMVRVVADGRRDVPEKLDNNNDRTLRVRPNPIEGALDIAVTDIYWVPQFPVDGQKVTFFAIIENIGNRTLLDDVLVRFQVDGVHKGQGHLNGMPESGTSLVSASWTVESGKNINITVDVDQEGTLDEMDAVNNGLTTWLNVSTPDLRVSSVDHKEGLYGEDGVVFVKIVNAGKGDFIRKFTTNLYVEGDLVGSEISDGIPAGENGTVTFYITRSWGEKEILVEVDPNGQVRESDEANIKLGELDLGYPDLSVEDVWYETGINASTTTAYALVRNLGKDIGTDFQVRVHVNGVDLGPKVLKGLDKNATAVVLWTFSTREVTRIGASVDDLNMIPEADELNNHFERNATGNVTYVAPDVNLHLASFEITQYGTPDDRYELVALVENQGIDVSGFSVLFLVDGRNVLEQSIPPMDGNTSKQVSMAWKGMIDDHVFKVVIDYYRLIAEYDETDNEARRVLPANQPPRPYPGSDQKVVKGERAELYARGYDIDGRIVLYEWDFDGDGEFEWVSNESGRVDHKYGKLPPKGQKYFLATLRVTDDDGAVSTASVKIKVVEKRPWWSPPPQDLAFIIPFAVGVMFIAAAIVLFILIIGALKPFRESPAERKRRLKREKEEGVKRPWPPWKKDLPEDLEDEEGKT